MSRDKNAPRAQTCAMHSFDLDCISMSRAFHVQARGAFSYLGLRYLLSIIELPFVSYIKMRTSVRVHWRFFLLLLLCFYLLLLLFYD
jgi:hypothetical protein